MSINNSAELTKLCEFPEYQKWQLVYRATEHGFGFNDFHAKSINLNNCLTIIKSESGNVFGGYTDATWNKRFKYTPDKNSFIFSLINKDNKPLKMKCSTPEYAVYGNPCPWIQGYGSGTDLALCSNSNVNNFSQSNLGFSYIHPSYAKASTHSNEFLAGSFNFKTIEIEMYIKQ